MLPIMQGKEPIDTICPKCNQQVTTEIEKKFNGWMWVVMLAICLPPLCFIPCCPCFGCEQVTHYCSYCKHAIGRAA